MLFICYPKCTTCQRAQKWLDNQGVAYRLRDIQQHNPTYEELKDWHAQSGLPLHKFFNTNGLLYKSLGLKEKLNTMDEEAQLKLLATDGMLVKRPLLVGDGVILIGFKEAAWQGAPLHAQDEADIAHKEQTVQVSEDWLKWQSDDDA
jgi:arsenate reductase